MRPFSDTGDYDGRAAQLSDPCFLIRHPKGTLLWDAGIGDRVAEMKDGLAMIPGFVATVPVTLRAQLQAVGLDYDRIDYFAFSHSHGDHVGNANLLTAATWLLNEKEMNWVQSPGDPSAALLAGYRNARTQMIRADHDVFGDGTVVILQTPGHTPGHQSLMIRLQHSGYVILGGDLWHQRESFEFSHVPGFNYSRAETLASMDRIRRIMERTGARLVIQHELRDFTALPRFPAFLD